MNIHAFLCRIRGRHRYDSDVKYDHRYALMPKPLYGLQKQRIGTYLTCRCGADKFFEVK